MSFGENLKQLRKNQGLSQKDLGDALELGQTTIANYEKNIRFPAPQILVNIADYFDCSIDFLFGREDIKLPIFTNVELFNLEKEILKRLLSNEETLVRDMVDHLKFNHKRLIQFYEMVMIPILVHTGILWQDGKISIAKEHFITNCLLDIARGISSKVIKRSSIKKRGKVICLSLSGEHHTFGIKMIEDYFCILGFETIMLGTDVPTDALIDMIMEVKPQFIAISVTMNYHLDHMQNLIKLLNTNPRINSNLDYTISYIVGGQGIRSEEEALSHGANIYAKNYKMLESKLKTVFYES